MIPLKPFNLLAQIAEQTRSTEGVADLRQAALELIESTIDEWKHIRRVDELMSPTPWDDRASAMKLSQEIYALHTQWEKAADEVLSRVTRLQGAKELADKTRELEDALGFTRARLLHTPELQERAFEQVRQGQTIPAKELRDELNARLRAGREVPMARA